MSALVGGPVGAVLLGNSWDCVNVGGEKVVFATLSTMDLSTLATCAVSAKGVVVAVRGASIFDWVSPGGAGVGVGAKT